MIKTPLSTVLGGAFWTPGATVIGGNTPTFDQQIQKLFANGEQGFAYDPNDLGTMYQDAAGTVPVTGVGQPVGLMLDKSKGLVLGDNIIKNGNFDNLDFWLANGTAGVDVAGNKLTLTRYISTDSVSQQLNTDIDGYYKVEVLGSPVQTGNARVSFGPIDSITSAQNTIVLSFSGKNSFIFKATTTTSYLLFGATVNGSVIEYSNISVKKVSGNHAYQTTSAARPILRQNALTGVNYLEFDGVDDRLTTDSFPSMGAATTLFIGSLGSSAGTAAIAARGVAGYLYQTESQVVVQSTNNSVRADVGGSTVITAKYAASGTGVTLKVNDVTSTNQLTTERGFASSKPLTIGAFDSGGGVPLSGHVYVLIGVSKEASDSESAAIEKELSKRLGVTLNV